MAFISEAEVKPFFDEVAKLSAKAVWCALATVSRGEPRVRIVHPTWDGAVLWLATQTGSPKLRQLAEQPIVDVQFQVAPPEFMHILVRGRAEAVSDPAERHRVWKLIDYDLGLFWKGGPDDPSYTPVRIDPDRVELALMFGMMKKRVWRRDACA